MAVGWSLLCHAVPDLVLVCIYSVNTGRLPGPRHPTPRFVGRQMPWSENWLFYYVYALLCLCFSMFYLICFTSFCIWKPSGFNPEFESGLQQRCDRSKHRSMERHGVRKFCSDTLDMPPSEGLELPPGHAMYTDYQALPFLSSSYHCCCQTPSVFQTTPVNPERAV
jgi:hypothetical protein